METSLGRVVPVWNFNALLEKRSREEANREVFGKRFPELGCRY